MAKIKVGVKVDDSGNVTVTQRPASGSWRWTRIPWSSLPTDPTRLSNLEDPRSLNW